MKKLLPLFLLLATTAFADEVITRGAAVPKEAKAIPLATVLDALRADSAAPVTSAQMQALYEVDRVGRGQPTAPNYAVLRGESW